MIGQEHKAMDLAVGQAGVFVGEVVKIHSTGGRPNYAEILPDSAAVRAFLGGPAATYELGVAHWEHALTLLPHRPNKVIHPATPGTARGWTREEVWEYDAASSGAVGDDAVGMYFESRYVRPTGPLHLPYEVVTLAFFVRGIDVDEADVPPKYEVCLQRWVTMCTDPKDPGTSEISSDVTYELAVDSTDHPDTDTAEAVARALAMVDARISFLPGAQ